MAQESFSTFDVVKILDVKRDTLKNWMDGGFIKPYKKTSEGRGPGERSLFSTFQLYLIRLFQVLLYHGLSRKQAAQLIESFSRDESSPDTTRDPGQSEKIITIFKGRSLPSFAKTSDEFLDLSNFNFSLQIERYRYPELNFDRYDLVHVINFEKIKREVDRLIDR